MLSALGQVVGAQSTPSAIEYAAGELRINGVPLAASAVSDANQRVRPLGYVARTEGDTVVLRQESAI
jgi:general secretion pathway protein L